MRNHIWRSNLLDFLKKMKVIVVDVLLPVVAFVLSLVALFISQSAQDDVVRMEAVKTEYGIYDDLAKLQLDNPLMSHLFAVSPAAYKIQKASINPGESSLTGAERSKLLLQEQAVAHYIFTDYEENYFLLQQAAGGEERRRTLLADNLDYFNQLLCGNPRLLWYWSETGRGLGKNFAQQLRSYYEENAAKDCPNDPDSLGPFSIPGGSR